MTFMWKQILKMWRVELLGTRPNSKIVSKDGTTEEVRGPREWFCIKNRTVANIPDMCCTVVDETHHVSHWQCNRSEKENFLSACTITHLYYFLDMLYCTFLFSPYMIWVIKDDDFWRNYNISMYSLITSAWCLP